MVERRSLAVSGDDGSLDRRRTRHEDTEDEVGINSVSLATREPFGELEVACEDFLLHFRSGGDYSEGKCALFYIMCSLSDFLDHTLVGGAFYHGQCE